MTRTEVPAISRRAADAAAAPVVSVVVVTWNVRALALRCLESIERHAGGVALEIIVVDNASADGTVDAVRDRFPQVTIVSNPENVGFPRANNQGLRLASGRYVLFLNPDTVLGEGVLPGCVAELESSPDVGMVGCRLIYPDGRIQYEGARNPYRLRHLAAELLYLHMLFPASGLGGDHLLGHWDHRGTRDVEAIMGAFMMVRRPLALELGGLPEDLFMYHEDLSFCLRVRRAGWRIRYRGDLITVHDANQSSRRSTAPLALLEGECKLRLIREAEGDVAYAAARVLFAVRSLLRLAFAVPARLVPGLRRLRERHPRVFDAKLHALQLAWSVAPWAVRRRVPRAPERPQEPEILRPVQAGGRP